MSCHMIQHCYVYFVELLSSSQFCRHEHSLQLDRKILVIPASTLQKHSPIAQNEVGYFDRNSMFIVSLLRYITLHW